MRLIRKCTYLVLATVTLISCGGGGGGGGAGGGGDQGSKITPINSPQPTDGPFAFYGTSSSLYAVDVNDTSKTFHINDLPRAAARSLMSATIGNNNTLVSDFANDQFIFASNDKLFSIDAKQGSDLSAREITSVSGSICEINLLENMADPNNSYVIFSTAPTSDECNNNNFTGRYLTPVGTTSSDTPMNVTAKTNNIYDIKAIFDLNNLTSITGFVAVLDASVVRYDTAMNNPVPIATGTSLAELIISSHAGSFSGNFMRVDNDIFYYDGISETLSSSLHTIAADQNLYSNVFQCNQVTCAFEEKNANQESTIYTIPGDGSDSASYFSGPTTGQTVDDYLLTDDSIYMVKIDQTTGSKSLEVSPLTAANFSPLVSGDIDINGLSTVADHSYFNVVDNATGETTAYQGIDADILNPSSTNSSRWVGSLMTEVHINQTIGPNKLILAKNYSDVATGLQGAQLVVVDALTGSETVTLGAVQNAITDLGLYGSNNKSIGYGVTFDPIAMTPNTDIYYINIDQADSFTQITHTPNLLEFPASR